MSDSEVTTGDIDQERLALQVRGGGTRVWRGGARDKGVEGS